MIRKETVTRVIDGDTFKTKSRKHSVRLANVYAPERGHQGFERAKGKLSRLINGKKVMIQTLAHDKHGRAVANVRVDNKSVNEEMARGICYAEETVRD